MCLSFKLFSVFLEPEWAQMRNNELYYLHRLIKWKLGDKSPIIAAIKITQQCNLRCTHCPWRNFEKNELSAARWKEVINNIWDRGCTAIVFEGGEPTLRSDLQELIEYASNLGFKTIVITNGTGDIRNISPDRIWVSIEGYEETHDLIRGKGTFDKAFETIRKNQDKRIDTLTTLSRTNSHDIERTCEALSEYVQGFLFNFLYPYKETKDEALSPVERMEVARRLLKLKKKYHVLNSDSYLKAVGTRWKCTPWALLSVTADGKFSNHCMIDHLEPLNCEECDLGCYGELSIAIGLKGDSLKFLRETTGALQG